MSSKSKNPLKVFVQHEAKAVSEAGKALLSILPKGLREHGSNAAKESAKGFEALGKGAIDAVESVVDEVKNAVKPSRKAHKDIALEVELDADNAEANEASLDEAFEEAENVEPVV